MALTPVVLAGIAALFLTVFLLGFQLTGFGKPYNGLILTIHKLAALAALVILALLVGRAARTAPLDAVVWIASLTGVVFFVIAIISGGLLSADKALPPAVKVLHRVSPFLSLLAIAVTLYLLP